MTCQPCTPSARGASLGLLCRERQADSDHRCHQWHWVGRGRSADRTRRGPRHRRPQQDENPHCVGSHQGGGQERSDGGDIYRRPLVAGLGAQIGLRGAGPLSKAECAHQQRRCDVRNTAADEGRHRTDLGGQPPGAVPTSSPRHPRRIREPASRSTISTPSVPIGALAATAKPSWPTSCSRLNWRDVSMAPG